MSPPIFKTTVVNLSSDGRKAVEGGGPVEVGSLDAEQLHTLLETFAELDPVENTRADPEIRIVVRRDRFIVRTGQKKLFFQDVRNLSEPTYVLSAEDIIAELDGTAAAKRTAPPFAMAAAPAPEPVAVVLPPPEETSRTTTSILLGLVLLLGGYAVYSGVTRGSKGDLPSLAALTPSERAAEDSHLTAVYMTGSQPGQHGLVILGDGKLKLFRVHAQAAPGVVYGTYQLGRIEGKVALATDQPGGLIRVLDRDSLSYCGETFRRIP